MDIILNEDCLAEIFSLLPLRDLLNVDKTCRLFSQILPKCRPPKIELEDWTIGPNPMEYLLTNVGKTIKSIEAREENNPHFHFHMNTINKYCVSLKSFKVTFFRRQKNKTRKELISIFKRIESLDFSYAPDMRMIALNSELLFPEPLPKMKYLSLDSFDFNLPRTTRHTEIDNIAYFCKSCPNLKELELHVDVLSANKLREAVPYMQQLESLFLKNHHRHQHLFLTNHQIQCKDISFLNELTKLKKLTLLGSFSEFCKLYETTHLKLIKTTLTVDSIKKLANMNQLIDLQVVEVPIDLEGIRALYNNNCQVIRIPLENFCLSKVNKYFTALLQLIKSSKKLKELKLLFERESASLKEMCEQLQLQNPHIKLIYNFWYDVNGFIYL